MAGRHPLRALTRQGGEGPAPAAPPPRTLRLTVEYDGAGFSGWQRQLGRRTVQACIEDAIRTVTGESVRIQGAGRTDAGVHADGQVASLRLLGRIPASGLLRALNAVLPHDVAVLEADDAPPTFDARRSARGKVYRYAIWNHAVRSPRQERFAWHVRAALCLPAMRGAARRLCGEHDFRGFRASDCDRRTTVRVVRRLDVERQGALVTVEVEATAFLKNMVRILVGTLVDVGRGRLDEAAVAAMLESGDRTLGGMTAPPQGLTLVRVIY